MKDDNKETPEAALQRIAGGFSGNDVAVVMIFASLGVDPDEILPRENVLTFKAWKAKGRKIAKGVNSISVPVYIPAKGKQEAEGDDEKPGSMMKRRARLFHESQTIPADSEKGTRPACLYNPHLMKPAVAVEFYGVTEAEIEAELNRLQPLIEEAAAEAAEQAEAAATLIEEVEPEAVAVEPEPTPEPPAKPAPVVELIDAPKPAKRRTRRRKQERPEIDREPGCNCPAPGLVINVACPLHSPDAKEAEPVAVFEDVDAMAWV